LNDWRAETDLWEFSIPWDDQAAIDQE
jgi:hypothetical protein